VCARRLFDTRRTTTDLPLYLDRSHKRRRHPDRRPPTSTPTGLGEQLADWKHDGTRRCTSGADRLVALIRFTSAPFHQVRPYNAHAEGLRMMTACSLSPNVTHSATMQRQDDHKGASYCHCRSLSAAQAAPTRPLCSALATPQPPTSPRARWRPPLCGRRCRGLCGRGWVRPCWCMRQWSGRRWPLLPESTASARADTST
jgi:hypothetical protein